MKGGCFILVMPAVEAQWTRTGLVSRSVGHVPLPSEVAPCWEDCGVLTLPPGESSPCGGPFTAESCSERGAESQNSPRQMCSFRKDALTQPFPVV